MQSKFWLLLLSLISSQSAFAAFRCGAYVIDEGMYKNEVFEKCGRATSVESHIERRSTGSTMQNQQFYGGQGNIYPNNGFNYGLNNSIQVEIIIEEWIYNFGSSRLQQYLRFENGRLIEIRDLNRGYR
jgi:hypothetical protein